MKLVKSLLLGSAAGLFAAAGAQAADLPRKAAAPVEYVRVCSTYGAGFFFIPGTDTCLRLSGFLRAETLYLEPFDRRDDALGFRARGRVQWDARTATEYGLLRSFIRMEMFRNTGSFVRTAATSERRGVTENSLSLNKGFIQFGNLTAGRFQSFFDFYANDYNYTSIFGMSDITTNGLAWTQPFGGGLSATLSIEDPLERRNISSTLDAFAFPGTGGFATPGTFGLSPIVLAPGGTRAPDLVANLRFDQAWGSAQLSGAAHQIRSAVLLGPGTAALTGVPGGVPAVAGGCPTVAGGGFTPVAGGFCDFSDDEWGFAIQGGVKINLPMIAAGDELWLQAVWSTGATAYATGGGTRVFGGTGSGTGTTAIAVRQTDAFIDPFTGDIEKVDAFSVAAVFRHYWTPNLRSIFFGAFTEVDNPGTAFTVTTVTGPTLAAPLGTVTTAGFADFRMYEAGASLIWSPVRNLDIGVEGVYRRLDPKGNVPLAVGGVAGIPTVLGSPVTRGSDDVWEARLRIQRDF